MLNELDTGRLEVIRQRLEELADGRMPERPTEGICAELTVLPDISFNISIALVKELAAKWPHVAYEGSSYPIPPTNKAYDNFAQYYNTSNLWIREQGKLRRSLCAFMASEIAKELEERSK